MNTEKYLVTISIFDILKTRKIQKNLNAGVSVQPPHSTFVEVKHHIMLLRASLHFGFNGIAIQEVPQIHYIVVYSCVWQKCVLLIEVRVVIFVLLSSYHSLPTLP